MPLSCEWITESNMARTRSTLSHLDYYYTEQKACHGMSFDVALGWACAGSLASEHSKEHSENLRIANVKKSLVTEMI